jgi:hypothetical protein
LQCGQVTVCGFSSIEISKVLLQIGQYRRAGSKNQGGSRATRKKEQEIERGVRA